MIYGMKTTFDPVTPRLHLHLVSVMRRGQWSDGMIRLGVPTLPLELVIVIVRPLHKFALKFGEPFPATARPPTDGCPQEIVGNPGAHRLSH